MKLKMFSVYDVKALVYGTPFFMPSVGVAVREFGDLANDPRTTISKHPADYILYQTGEFNDADGEVVSIVPPVHLGLGSDFFKSEIVPLKLSDSSVNGSAESVKTIS